jgi:hypothetical protein
LRGVARRVRHVQAAIPPSEQAVPSSSITSVLITTSSPRAGAINDLDTGVHTGWVRTGYRFSVIKRGSAYAGTTPMCASTADAELALLYREAQRMRGRESQVPRGMQFESGEVFRRFRRFGDGMCPADTTPDARLYNIGPTSTIVTPISSARSCS